MITLRLNDLRFNAFHGLHYEESIIGSEYSVDVIVKFYPNVSVIRSIDETVDYSAIFSIIKKNMQQPTALLETLAMEMAVEIGEKFPQVHEIDVRIFKLNAPVENLNGKLGVGYSWTRN